MIRLSFATHRTAIVLRKSKVQKVNFFIAHTISLYYFIDEGVAIDTNEFKNKAFQCVFQYLTRFNAKIDLSNFTYEEPSVEGDYSSCISTIKRFVHILF